MYKEVIPESCTHYEYNHIQPQQLLAYTTPSLTLPVPVSPWLFSHYHGNISVTLVIQTLPWQSRYSVSACRDHQRPLSWPSRTILTTVAAAATDKRAERPPPFPRLPLQ